MKQVESLALAMLAVVTALLIAFLINPMLIRWLKVKQGDYRVEERGLGPQEQIVVFTLRSLLPRPIGVSSPGWTDVRSS